MKRTPMKRTLRRWDGPTIEREPRPMAKLERPGVYGPAVLAAAPKDEPGRNRALLDMAHGRRCLLLAVEACETTRGQTTVACHRNEGKGMATKQSDEQSAWGCAPCHRWLDQSGSPRVEKRRAFAAAHVRQIAEWRRIASDPAEPQRFRDAARWALGRIERRLA